MQPTRAEHFTFLHWAFDPLTAELQLHYAIPGHPRLTERVLFPSIDAERYARHQSAIHRAFDLLHWMAGVSYYKTGLSRHIQFTAPAPPPPVAAWLGETYRSGLAELAYVNGLPAALQTAFEAGPDWTDAAPLPLQRRALVAIGGGKDSLVCIEQLKRNGADQTLFMFGNSAFIRAVAKRTGLPLLQVRRELPQALHEINQTGAFNGHVPITAINACVGVAAALLFDYDAVVFANESSANAANARLPDGSEVNHQYSKSLAFERAMQGVVQRFIAAELRVFSLLRPYTELAIVRRFAELTRYHAHFSSCNRNFHLQGSRNHDGHWCGACPKCHFVFLTLAPFVPKAALVSIFGDNLLNRPEWRDAYAALLGLREHKPFECVGEAAECRAALQWLAARPEWREDALVAELSGCFKPLSEAETARLLCASDDHLIPSEARFNHAFE